jgi:hypothetical protein
VCNAQFSINLGYIHKIKIKNKVSRWRELQRRVEAGEPKE